LDLRERLRALNGGRPLAAAAPVRRTAGIETVLPGREVTAGAGVAYVVERRLALAAADRDAIQALAGWSASQLAELTGDARLAAFNPSRMVVLDTETTGLAGGTGTYTFLVGLGTFEDAEFVVRQYFLRSLTEERAMLAHLATVLNGAGGILTYNGRSFDWPLLVTRFTLTRQRAILPDLPHWDLLPLARRLWRDRVGSCRLGALEHHVLARPRDDDTPGWLIPQLYFDYLRDGDARRLRGVFEHNQRDLVALASLAALAGRRLLDPFAAGLEDAREIVALARHDEVCGRCERAVEVYRTALGLPLPPAEREAALRSLSLLLKRLRRWPEAAAVWAAMQRQPLADPTFPALELAKYYEHVARDYVRAAAVVERLATAVALRRAPDDVAALDHRLARLRRRVGTVQ
jgi:uncharacterized protein YprB with RNaseH-like and TPR domain